LRISIEAVGIDGEASLVGQLIALNAGNTDEVGDLLTERKIANVISQNKSRIASGTPLWIVGHTSTNSTGSIGESEGCNAWWAHSVGIDTTKLHLLADTICIQIVTITTAHTSTILVSGAVHILRLALSITSQIFVDLADETDSFCCVLAPPWTSN
jgi:hypothetical protein